MRLPLYAMILLSLTLNNLFADDIEIVSDSDRSRLPAARGLLDGCIAALPDVPLLITGQLQAKQRTGETDRKLNVEMLLDWQATPPSARYTIRDSFGHAREHLSVTWETDRDPEYHYLTGDPLVAAPLPVLSEAIEGTDISWMDLSLSFLRWQEAKTVAAEEVRGRVCYVIDLAAPPNDFTNCAGVRAWIDPKIPVLLRAEAFDPAAQLIRRMDVVSFKKINKRWVIQNIEIVSFPSRHKTVLRVRDVQDRTRKVYIQQDGGEDEAVEEPAQEDVDNVLVPGQQEIK